MSKKKGKKAIHNSISHCASKQYHKDTQRQAARQFFFRPKVGTFSTLEHVWSSVFPPTYVHQRGFIMQPPKIGADFLLICLPQPGSNTRPS